jgi:hypothetical protein
VTTGFSNPTNSTAAKSAKLFCANLRGRVDDDFRFPFVQLNLSRHRDRFSFVLLRVSELSGAARGDESRKRLIGIFATHVQKNVAFPGLMEAIHSASYRCCFADMLCRFLGRIAMTTSLARARGRSRQIRDDGKRFVAHADEKLTAFLELESAVEPAAQSS